ncbi:MAG TPA: flagellin [Symbiobacteriaceae bacterium]|jgi:flagellin|nr:flagellin [Symbiobacteriaceae bacterium]
MRINNNMAAMNAWRNLSTNGSNMAKSLERLSSGYRINKAADDAAGLAVSEKMRAQIRGINMATRNTQDAVSMVQTAEGGASKIQDMLQRMRELAVQAGSDTLGTEDRAKLTEEFTALRDEIDRTAGTVTFNGKKLINGQSGTLATTTGTGLSGVRVTGDVAGAADYNVNITGVAKEQVQGSGLKDESGAAMTVTATDTLATKWTTLAATDTITFTQENKAITINLKDNEDKTFTEFAALVNDAAEKAGMSMRMQYKPDNTLSIESNVDGTHGDVTVLENYTDVDKTFGFTASQASTDAAGTITNADTGEVYDLATSSAVKVKGNTITGAASDDLKGLEFTAAAAGAATVAVTNNGLTFQVGANQSETISATLGNLTAANLGLTATGFGIGERTSAASALDTLDTALSSVSTERAKMGAMQNRLENTISTLQTQNENLTAAESRIRDLDMAAEMAQFTKHQVLQQASTSMLAQANQLSQGVLSLLQ